MHRKVLLSVLFATLTAAHAQSQPYAGQTITVLLPPWGTLPKSMLDSFTKSSGINVDMQTLGWDEIRAKIVTSMVAGTPPADITELDWSWVGQFGASNWYTPLDKLIDPKLVADIGPSKIFTYNKQLLGIPYANDFRVVIYNKAMFNKAGIKTLPTTPQNMFKAAQQLKAKGVVKYPIAVPMSATEGSATVWYMLTKAFGGDLFSADMKPLFTAKTSPGYQALKWELDALKAGLIDPGATGLTDVQAQDNFKAGKAAIDLAGWPGNLPVYNDKAKSKVAGNAAAMTVPGTLGKSRTFGLPEALGIPSNSEHKEAAAEFIKWWMQPANQQQAYTALGVMPTRTSVLQTLNKAGKLQSGAALVKQLGGVEPLYAGGTPQWHPQFSADVAAIINRAAKGQLNVDQAIAAIAEAAAKAQK